MGDYKKMTPIELNVLINKTKGDHENIKSNIKKLLDEVDAKGIEINKNFEQLENVESKYVQLINVLIDK